MLKKPPILLIFVALLLLTSAILVSFGRRWWCQCGSLSPWSWDIWSSHNSQHLIDPYTFSHVLHGVILYALTYQIFRALSLRKKFFLTVAIEILWEIFENTNFMIERYRAATISLNYFGDSIFNSLFDIIACACGFVLASYLSWRTTLLLALVTEVVLLLTIRDNLTLNILMLVCPIDAIREWQSAL